MNSLAHESPSVKSQIDITETALWYASGKWAVFPCAPDSKIPLTKSGYQDASTDPAIIAEWWQKWPRANIGLACGMSGLIALDGDPCHYTDETRAFLADLRANYPTTAQVTASDGEHFIYRLPDGVSLGNSSRNLPPGVDVRVRGYIVLAPSTVVYHGEDASKKGVDDGYRGHYEWQVGKDPLRCAPKPLPQHVIELLTRAPAHVHVEPQQTAHKYLGGDMLPYVKAAIERELNDLATCPVGGRSTHVFATAARLGEFVALGQISEGDAERDILDAASRCGILQFDGEAVTRRAIRNGLERGKMDPKPLPAPKTIYTNGADDGPPEMPWMPTDSDMPPADFDHVDDGAPDGPHPLDIQPKTDLELGWIDEYADLMTHLTGSPREFNVLAGLAIVATAIQRRARLRMSFGDIFPNIYGAVIAPSSVYHKSSALAKPRALLQRAMLDNLLLSELFTSEGLLKQLQGQPAGLALRDEIGTLFASHNTKYLASLKPDLTALYDCYPYSRSLSGGDVKVQAPYLNILGATTPTRFFEGVSYQDWQDGFLARWLFVMPEQEPDFDAMAGMLTNEHDAQLGRLAIRLMEVDRQRETDFEMVSPAFGLWRDWQRQAAKDAYYYGDDIAAAIVTRYAAYALKFALILSAVNGSWGSVTPGTMQTAMDLADGFKATVYKLLNAKANYGVSGAKLQKIFRIIKGKAGTEGITQREIGRICTMKKSELVPCMEKLISIGAVISLASGKTERYIPAIENLPAKAW